MAATKTAAKRTTMSARGKTTVGKTTLKKSGGTRITKRAPAKKK